MKRKFKYSRLSNESEEIIEVDELTYQDIIYEFGTITIYLKNLIHEEIKVENVL